MSLHIYQIDHIQSMRADPWLARFAFAKENVPFIRLAALALAGTAAFAIATVVWAPLRRLLGWLLLPLGQNPLTAYSLHFFAVAVAAKLSEGALSGWMPHKPDVLAVQIGSVLAVWLVVVTEPAG